MRTCKFVAGPTSSNKTGLMLFQAAGRCNNGKKTLLVGPSIKSLEEYKQRGESAYPGVNFELYHSELRSLDGSGSVRVDVERALDNLSTIYGRVICITHASFQNLDACKKWLNWAVFIDEALEVFEPAEKNLHYSHGVITEGLSIDTLGPSYAKFKVTSHARIRAIAEDRNKDVLRKEVSGIARRLLNSNYDTYTLTASYDELIKIGGKSKKLYAYSVYSSRCVDQFQEVTVLSARFDESIHYHVWRHEGVEWIEDIAMTKQLKFQTHQGYEKLSIYYGYEQGFSKRSRDNNSSSYEAFVHESIKTMEQQTFIRLENNDIKHKSLLSKTRGGITIEGRSNGLNCYKDIDHGIVISALNYSPQASKFLERRYGISREAQFIGFSCHAIYQALSRTSMRDGDLSIKRRWVVPTLSHAQWLSSVFEGSSIVSLGLTDQPSAGRSGRPKQFTDSNARKLHSKINRRKCEKQMSEFEEQIADNVMQDVPFINGNYDVVNTIITKGDIVALHRASIFKHQFDNNPRSLIMKPNEFRSYLKKQSNLEYENKHDVPLISPAFYNPSLVAETNRGRKNTIFASGIMLDFDNSELKPVKFARLFPQVGMTLYNTYSNEPDDLRYRAYIETTRPTLVAEYKTIVNGIITVLEDNGYTSRPRQSAKPRGSGNVRYHGIDMTKRGPYSIFHLPCEARDKTKGSSFFQTYIGPDRSPLDVNEWLSNLPPILSSQDYETTIHHLPMSHSTSLSSIQESEMNAAMNEWYRYGILPGNGCEGIRTLFTKLHRLKVPDDIVNDNLYAAARSANSPEDRRRQVDGLIRSRREHLSRYRPTMAAVNKEFIRH